MDDMEAEEKMTYNALMTAPSPAAYLEVLVQHKIVTEQVAYSAAMRYIELHNQLRSFNDWHSYSIKPFETMKLNDLISYIRFIHDHKLQRIKIKSKGKIKHQNQTPASSIVETKK
jgi:hypothetical protein